MTEKHEVCSSALDFENVPLRDESVVDSQRIVTQSGLYFPRVIDNLTLKFEINSSTWFLDPYQLELRMGFQIVKEDGTTMPDSKMVVPACGILSSIKTLEVWSRGRKIKTYDDYHYLSHVTTLMLTPKSWFDSLGSVAGFLPDADACEGPSWEAGSSPGSEYRRSMAAESRVYTLYSRLWAPVIIQERLLSADVNNTWEIHCHLNDSAFMIQTSTELVDEKYKMMIHSAELVYRKCQLGRKALDSIQTIQNNAGLSYPIRDFDIQSYTFYAGSQGRTTPTSTLPMWPLRIWIFFTDQAATSGRTKNPFWYQNFGVEEIELMVGARKFTLADMKWDLVKDFDVSAAYYNTVYRGLGMTEGFIYGIRDFARIASVFVFDVTNSSHSAECDGLIPVPAGPTGYSVAVKFKKALAQPILMKVITEYSSVMNIAREGEVGFSA